MRSSFSVRAAREEDVEAAECRDRGGQALLWTVYPANLTARRFYEELGGRATAEQLMSWSMEG